MVRDDRGQLYTIEGFAAALIMICTAFLVVNATSVYTAGDTHINDMQLEALGNDALMIMDTPMNTTENNNGNSTLRTIIELSDSSEINTAFRTKFLEFVNFSGSGPKHDIQFVANYTCRIDPGTDIQSYPLSYSRNLTGGEHSVKVTRWVIVDKIMNDPDFCGTNGINRAVLVEVLLWRD